MRRKILQDHANTFCQMLVGWRMSEDLETLAQLPDGVLFIDVLSGKATHSAAGPIDLGIAAELQAWFSHRLQVARIPVSEIRTASVWAAISTSRIATNRKKIISFDFSIESKIETSEAKYSGNLEEVNKWHQRLPYNISLQRTTPTGRR